MPIYEHSKRVASVSAAFYNAGMLATQRFSLYQDGYIYLNTAAFFASVTNFAFACETALKAKLPFKTKGHLLVDLFKKLEVNEQNELIEYVCLESRNREIKCKTVHINICVSREDFLVLLNESDNIFRDARYIYEDDPETTRFSLWFLRSLAKCALIPHGYEVDEETGLINYLYDNDIMMVRLKDEELSAILER